MQFLQAFLAGPRAVNCGWYFNSCMGALAACRSVRQDIWPELAEPQTQPEQGAALAQESAHV